MTTVIIALVEDDKYPEMGVVNLYAFTSFKKAESFLYITYAKVECLNRGRAYHCVRGDLSHSVRLIEKEIM